MAFIHAYRAGGGVPATVERQPGSAFSKGDVLELDGSNVSGWRVVSGPDIYGVAMSDSVDSYNDNIVVQLPGPDDVFFSTVTPNSLLSVGDEVDLVFDANERHVVNTSTNTARVVIVKGQNDVLGQSDESRVLVKFIYHAGNVELS